MPRLTLISHPLCPYVQRVAIALIEKAIPFERIDIDLANKPEWFKTLSPLGKTPVLKVGERAIFESAVILEYLEDTGPRPLHPEDPLTRAEHRAWIEFASSLLNEIAGFYNAPDAAGLEARARALAQKWTRVETRLDPAGPFFDGPRFCLVDAAFAPVFRYFDAFDAVADFALLAQRPRNQAWRAALARRPSVQAAVASDYPAALREFLAKRGSHLSHLMRERQRS